jgi:hypothetical protein
LGGCGVCGFLGDNNEKYKEIIRKNKEISERWTKSENPISLCDIHHRQNPIVSRRTAVYMQQQGKHTSITIEELLGNGIFCSVRP